MHDPRQPGRAVQGALRLRGVAASQQDLAGREVAECGARQDTFLLPLGGCLTRDRERPVEVLVLLIVDRDRALDVDTCRRAATSSGELDGAFHGGVDLTASSQPHQCPGQVVLRLERPEQVAGLLEEWLRRGQIGDRVLI